MTRRLVLHAGFHKTGTTTLQATLAQNADILAPHVDVCLPDDIPLRLLAYKAQEFSERRDKASKTELRDQAAVMFSLYQSEDPRPVFISHENLAGHYMGHKNVFRYAAAPIILGVMRDAWQDVTGSPAGFEAYYSTRRDGWLGSCHWQRLKKSRYKESLDVFSERYADAADFDPILERARDAIAPCPLHSTALEEIAHPIDPVLDLLGLSRLRGALTLPENQNTSLGEEARDQLLALNRSDLRGKDYWDKRRAITREARAQSTHGTAAPDE